LALRNYPMPPYKNHLILKISGKTEHLVLVFDSS
jgi:hypothetical protein